MMKKIVALVLAVLFCAQTAIPTLALIPKHTNVVNSNIYTEGINNFSEDQAAMLKELGLFIGSDKGFELERHLTRVEAGVLLVRALGMESEALAQTNTHPFKDVPSWADKQVGWLYQNKITAGVGATAYGSSQSITYWQFAMFLSRACAGNDNFIENGVGKLSEQNQCDGQDESPGNGFYRADAVGMLTRFLMLNYSVDPEEPMTVAQHLIQKGVFSAETLGSAGLDVYPIWYENWHDYTGDTTSATMVATMLNVPIRSRACKSISQPEPAVSALPYFYSCYFGEAESSEERQTVLYRTDCITLEETEIARFEAASPNLMMNLTYFATIDGQDYLDVTVNAVARLIRVNGETAEVLAEGKRFNLETPHRLRYAMPQIWQDNVLALTLDDTLYIAAKSGCKGYPLAAGTKFVALQDDLVVLSREENGAAVVEGMHITDGRIADSYRAAMPMNYRPTVAQHDDGIYGMAGLFIVRDEHLLRVTSRPVFDVAYPRRSAMSVPAILTANADSYTGDTIIVLPEDGINVWTEEILLGNNPPHGITITQIDAIDSRIAFYAEENVGMENYNVYAYQPVYNDKEGHMGIWVTGFTAGRPEMMAHPADWYAEQEQARLNALGFHPGIGK